MKTGTSLFTGEEDIELFWESVSFLSYLTFIQFIVMDANLADFFLHKRKLNINLLLN